MYMYDHNTYMYYAHIATMSNCTRALCARSFVERWFNMIEAIEKLLHGHELLDIVNGYKYTIDICIQKCLDSDELCFDNAWNRLTTYAQIIAWLSYVFARFDELWRGNTSRLPQVMAWQLVIDSQATLAHGLEAFIDSSAKLSLIHQPWLEAVLTLFFNNKSRTSCWRAVNDE